MRITHSWTIIALNCISLKYIKKSLLQIWRGIDRNTKVLGAIASLSLCLGQITQARTSKNIEEPNNSINQADLTAMDLKKVRNWNHLCVMKTPRALHSFWACSKQGPLTATVAWQRGPPHEGAAPGSFHSEALGPVGAGARLRHALLFSSVACPAFPGASPWPPLSIHITGRSPLYKSAD